MACIQTYPTKVVSPWCRLKCFQDNHLCTYKSQSGASVVPDFHRCCFVAAVVDSLFDYGAFQAILPKARSCKLRILRIRFYLKPAQQLGCSTSLTFLCILGFYHWDLSLKIIFLQADMEFVTKVKNDICVKKFWTPTKFSRIKKLHYMWNLPNSG